MTGAAPLTQFEFAAAMAALAPFEAGVRLAVAVSGGADSLALAVLARAWVGRRRGRLTALIVDHGLRPDSADETRHVARQLRALGISNRRLTLDWPGGRPESGLQARAREARYAALAEWCAAHGYLHLAVAHHLEDQGETVLMRLAHASGIDGLAGMAAVVERPQCRILRPLLGVPRDRLRALLDRCGVAWIEDPSNVDPRFERTRVRAVLAGPGGDELGPERLAGAAAELGRLRAQREAEVTRCLAVVAACDPAGFVHLDRDALRQLPADLAIRVIGRCAMTVSGRRHPPRRGRLAAAVAAVAADESFSGRTLAGCRLHAARPNVLYVARELAACAPPARLEPGSTQLWDGRFAVTVPATTTRTPPLTVAALGQLLRADRRRAARRQLDPAWPAAVVASLPAVRRGAHLYVDDRCLAAAAPGSIHRRGAGPLRPLSALAGGTPRSRQTVRLAFVPALALGAAPFAVAVA